MALMPSGSAMPVPPQPVIPPEGLSPTPGGVGTDLSPTTMVLNYLKSRGYQPSSENVRRALEANSRDPGVIPGLRSDTAATDAQDQAAMAAARGGGGTRAPYVPSGTGGKSDETPIVGSPATTSAAPAATTPNNTVGGDSGLSNIGMSILGGLPLAALAYGASKIPPVGSRAGPMPDVGAGVPGAVPTRPGATPGTPGGGPGEIDYTQMPAEGNRITTPELLPPSAANTAPSPMTTALDRATAPAGTPSFVGDVAPVSPAQVGNMTVGPSTVNPAVLNEANIGSGATRAPDVPIQRTPERVLATRAPRAGRIGRPLVR